MRHAGLIAVAAVALAALEWTDSAWGGGGTFGDDEEQELAGHRYIGHVRDRSGNVIADAKITVELKVGTVILRSDQDGHFVISGFGANVDPEDVKFTCSKEGLKEIGKSKQVMGDGPTAPVEVNCILGPP